MIFSLASSSWRYLRQSLHVLEMASPSGAVINLAYSVCGLAFPVKLINKIIGYAALLDFDTVLSVCLVCKWWADICLRVARRALPITAYLVRSGDDAVAEESRSYLRRVEELASFVYLPQYVQEITFCGPNLRRRVGTSVRGLSLFKDHLHHCTVRRVLELLPRVDVLRLEGVEWIDCPVEDAWYMFPKREFKRMVLSDVRICGEQNHPVSVLHAAKSVNHLIMGYERGSVDFLEDTSSTALRRITLQHLGAVTDNRFDVLFLARPNTIVRLDVNSMAPHNIGHMRVLLLKHVESLEHLGLGFYIPDISAYDHVTLLRGARTDNCLLDVDSSMWSTLPLAQLMTLRTFVLELDVLDWEPEESNTMQDTALSCLKTISPTITNLQLHFYLIDIELASVRCLLSESRWIILDGVVSQLLELETFEIVLNVKVFLGVDEYISKVIEDGLRIKFLQALHRTAGQSFCIGIVRMCPDDIS